MGRRLVGVGTAFRSLSLSKASPSASVTLRPYERKTHQGRAGPVGDAGPATGRRLWGWSPSSGLFGHPSCALRCPNDHSVRLRAEVGIAIGWGRHGVRSLSLSKGKPVRIWNALALSNERRAKDGQVPAGRRSGGRQPGRGWSPSSGRFGHWSCALRCPKRPLGEAAAAGGGWASRLVGVGTGFRSLSLSKGKPVRIWNALALSNERRTKDGRGSGRPQVWRPAAG